jgi:hypothetical protein
MRQTVSTLDQHKRQAYKSSEISAMSRSNQKKGTSSRITDDLNEIYGQTLAAELLREPGQPSAEEVIEDIFSGGDGWSKYKQQQQALQQHHTSITVGTDEGGASDGELKTILQPNKRSWPDFAVSSSASGLTGRRLFGEQARQHDRHEHLLVSGHLGPGAQIRRNSSRGSFGKEDPFRIVGLKRRGSFAVSSHDGDLDGWVGQVPEVDEFDVRDDLRCWNTSNS